MKKLLTNIYLIIVLVLVPGIIQGQDNERKINIIPFPIIGTNPTVGFVYGFSPGFTWHMGDKENTSMSSIISALAYTTNRQLFFSIRGNIFFNEDKWSIMTDLRYQMASQPTYGLGTRSGSIRPIVNSNYGYSERHYLKNRQMMEYDLVRVHITGLKRYEDTRFFFGVGYHLDAIYNIDDHLLNLDTVPQQITQHYRYNTLKDFSTKGNTVAGVSLNLIYDSRDNIANPYSGRYGFASYRANSRFLGSPQNSSTLWLEYRDYFNLSKQRPRHLIALWAYGWFVTEGKLPYMNLPALGWDMFSRSGRAYTYGRFRGEDLIYTELEYRFPLLKNNDLLGGVIFANATTASSRTEDIDLFQHINLAYGLGLRIMINKRSRSNINIDYGWATNGSRGLFLSLNEVF